MIQLRTITGAVLTLPSNVSLTREIETTIFNRELTVTDFTYPVDLPLTDEVILALGFPNSIANPNLKQDHICDFIIDGIYIDQVALRVLKVDKRNKTLSVSLIGKYGMFARIFGEARVCDLSLGGIRTIGALTGTYLNLSLNWTSPTGSMVLKVFYMGNNVADHIQQVNEGTIVTDYVFGQAMDTVNTLSMQGTGSNTINGWAFYWPGTASWGPGVRDPVWQYLLTQVRPPGIPITAIPSEDRWWWVPHFKLHYVLRKALEEYGFIVSGSVFTDPKFQAIVLYNTYAINKSTFSYSANAGTNTGTLNVIHDATTIDPRNHVPAMPIIEWLQEVAKNFNLHYDIDLRAMTIEVRRIGDVKDYGSVMDLTERTGTEPILNFEEQDYSRGYAFSFEDNGDAQVHDDVYDFHFYGCCQSRKYLPGATGAQRNYVVYVLDENTYYQWDGFEWVFFCDNLGTYKTSQEDNVMEMKTKAGTLKMRRDGLPLFEPTSGGYLYYDSHDFQVNPVSSLGIFGTSIFTFDAARYHSDTSLTDAERLAPCFYLASTDRPAHNPVLLNYLGMCNMDSYLSSGHGRVYPLLSPVPYDAFGVLQPNGYCLTWDAPRPTGVRLGLYNEWWAKLVAQLAGCIEAEYEVLLDALLLNNIDWNANVFRINGLLFLCKKASILLPLPDVATLQLVRV